jgi:hypothetical protein
MNRYLLAVFAAGVWMNLSEFIRNELLLKDRWVAGFKDIGLSFPSEPLNGAVWALWAFVFVAFLTQVSTKFDVISSTIISWSLGFVLLWVAVWNMGILPSGFLYWAVPWSFVEVYVAALIINRIVVRHN